MPPPPHERNAHLNVQKRCQYSFVDRNSVSSTFQTPGMFHDVTKNPENKSDDIAHRCLSLPLNFIALPSPYSLHDMTQLPKSSLPHDWFPSWSSGTSAPPHSPNTPPHHQPPWAQRSPITRIALPCSPVCPTPPPVLHKQEYHLYPLSSYRRLRTPLAPLFYLDVSITGRTARRMEVSEHEPLAEIITKAWIDAPNALRQRSSARRTSNGQGTGRTTLAELVNQAAGG